MANLVHGGALRVTGGRHARAKHGVGWQRRITSIAWNAVLAAIRDIRAELGAVTEPPGLVLGIQYLKATGTTADRSAALQALLDNSGHVYVGPGTHWIAASVDVKSNTRLQLHPLAVLKRSLSMPPSTQMIRVALGVGNVIIEGGTIDGNKQSPNLGAGGQAAGVTTNGAHDVVIRDMVIKDFPADPTGASYGYGIYLGSGGTYNQRITISNVNCYGHEQNCVFLVAGRDILIENSTFSDSPGKTPGSGLNIEPNLYTEVIQNVVVRNCVFERNSSGATCNNHYSGYWHDVLFDGCSFRNNRNAGMACSGAALSEANFRFVNCTFVNNSGDGLSAGGVYGLQVTGCRSEGNARFGFDLFNVRNFEVAHSHVHNNQLGGANLRVDEDVPAGGTVLASSFFNNGSIGFAISKSVVRGTAIAGVEFAFNKSGNSKDLSYGAWPSAHEVIPDFRISKGGEIYECITTGVTAPVELNYDAQTSSFAPGELVTGGRSHATGVIDTQTGSGTTGTLKLRDVAGVFQDKETLASTTGSATVNGAPSAPGPTGIGADIIDGTAHWKHVMTLPVQAWGYSLAGEAARGASLTKNSDLGNTDGHIYELPAGDANTIYTADILRSSYHGQAGATQMRVRALAGETIAAAGDAKTNFAAGIAAIAAGASSVMITSPFAETGDAVQVTLRDAGKAITSLSAKVTAAGVITVTGDATASADCSFSWELVKIGTL